MYCYRYFLPIIGLCVIAVGSALATPSYAQDRCAQLVALSHEYAGVALNPSQKQIKRRLVVWYNRNCRGRRSAAAN